jgi:hypothetical protein
MSRTLALAQQLIARGEVRISEHGYDELAADGLTVAEILAGAGDAQLIEDYPQYPKGPCVLVLQKDGSGKPIHVVWGIPGENTTPAVLVTAYRPDPAQWSDDFRTRL